jgi:quinoprotein glucose dehydrogenase
LLPTTEMVPASLQVLAKYDAKESLPRFIEATQSRETEVRQLGWDILAKHDSSEALACIVGGVQSYLDGSLPADVHLNVLEAAQGKLDQNLQDSLLEHNRSLSEADTLANWLVALEGGNQEAGKKIFFEKTQLSCVRCHKVDRAGGEVGPALTVIGKEKDRRYLLEAICLPDAQIAKGFETAVIADDSGQVFTGIVKSENDDYVELIQSDGTQKRIVVEEIVARRKGKSAMPDNLIKSMTLRELRDMVAYLSSLKVDPREAAKEIE